jgi:hypothetical protein
MSPCRIETLPPRLSPASVPLPLKPQEGGTLACGEGLGSPNSDDYREKLSTLPTLYVQVPNTVGPLFEILSHFKGLVSDLRDPSHIRNLKSLKGNFLLNDSCDFDIPSQML